MKSHLRPQAEKPENGIAGLKHWRHDLAAGLQVALIWLPFSLGVAIASGAPAVAGVISAIIAGLVFTFLGGSYVTISGPAAALAPVLLWGMLLLGEGDLAAGYPLILIAIFLTGILQILLSLGRAGQYASFLPATVVEGMLAAIGLIIIVGQIPSLLGAAAPPGKSVIEALQRLPEVLARLDPAVAAAGLFCLALMFVLHRMRDPKWRLVPPPLAAAAAGIVLGYLVAFDPRFLIEMPASLFDGIHPPDLTRLVEQRELWLTMLLVVITFTMIDGIESLASIKAVDKIDPFRRKSDPNVTLRAMGVCNTLSSLAGGLTVIPNAVPSRASIDAGARTLWANFYSGAFLLIFLFFLKDILGRIPLSAIAAILIYVGWRLAEPAVFRKALAIGRDRFLIFTFTVAAILATDLLTGMLLGVAAELVLLIYLLMPSVRHVLTGRLGLEQSFRMLWQNLSGLFRSPVIRHRIEQTAEGERHLLSVGSVVGFNLLPLQKTLAAIPGGAPILVRITESARIIDHTAMEYLRDFEEACLRERRAFALQGLENFYRFSHHSLSTRMQDPLLAQETEKHTARAQEMAGLAERHGLDFAPDPAGTLNRHDFIYLRRGDNREESNVLSGTLGGCRVKLFDYSHTSAPDYHLEHRHTLIIIEPPAGAARLPDLVVTPGHYLERYLVNHREVALSGQPELARIYRLYGRAGEDPHPWLARDLARFLLAHAPLYLEARDNVLLAFRPNRGLEPPQAIGVLLDLAAVVDRLAGDARGTSSAPYGRSRKTD